MESDNEIRTFALRLLARREHSVFELREKLARRFPEASESTFDNVVEFLRSRKYLDDARYAHHVAGSNLHRGKPWLEAKLRGAGIDERMRSTVLGAIQWPSLDEAIEQNMIRMKLDPPLGTQDAVRLSRTLARLGYDIDEIRLELERLI